MGMKFAILLHEQLLTDRKRCIYVSSLCPVTTITCNYTIYTLLVKHVSAISLRRQVILVHLYIHYPFLTFILLFLPALANELNLVIQYYCLTHSV
jgi:hypothetical protein